MTNEALLEDSSKKSLPKRIFLFCCFILCYVAGVGLKTLGIQLLWNAFLSPALRMPALSFGYAFSLIVLVALFTIKYGDYTKEKEGTGKLEGKMGAGKLSTADFISLPLRAGIITGIIWICTLIWG